MSWAPKIPTAIDKLMDVAKRAGCDALNPGYGFLSENPALPEACEKAGLTSVDIAYRTGADFLNDLASGAIDYAIPDNVQAMAQQRAGSMKILGVGAGERMKSAPEIAEISRRSFRP